MNGWYIVIAILFLLAGTYVMSRNKFYKHPTDDMLFATELKVFLGGLTLGLVGFYVLASEVIGYLK